MLVIHPAATVVAEPVWHPVVLQVTPPSPGDPVCPPPGPPLWVIANWLMSESKKIKTREVKLMSRVLFMQGIFVCNIEFFLKNDSRRFLKQVLTVKIKKWILLNSLLKKIIFKVLKLRLRSRNSEVHIYSRKIFHIGNFAVLSFKLFNVLLQCF